MLSIRNNEMIRKLERLLLSLTFILNIYTQGYASDLNDEYKDITRLNTLLSEAFLGKNKTVMTKVGRGRYKVNDDQFNEIFPSTFLVANNPDDVSYNSAVGFIDNEFFDPATGSTIVNTGTGTIIENNNAQTVKILTAAHVVEKKGDITFTLGSTSLLPGNPDSTHLAVYKANRVFLHNTEDVAYIECKLDEMKVSEEILKNICMPKMHQNIDKKRQVGIFHYPFGVENQRFNKGFIYANNNDHTLPTLGGSSGAPIIYNGQIIGVHTRAGNYKGGIAEYKNENLRFSSKNTYVKLQSINPLLTDFTERQ